MAERLEGIITDGIDGDVVLIGFPYDEGVVRAGGRRGAELGPDCMRRFLPKIGPIENVEYGLSVAGLRLTDYGNIVQDTFEDAHKKLETKLLTVLNKPQAPAAVVVGGGWDQSYSTALGFFPYCTQRSLRPEIISISSALGVAQAATFQSGSQFRSLMDSEQCRALAPRLHCFAAQGTAALRSEVEYVTNSSGEVTWLDQIRQRDVPTMAEKPRTQAGIAFKELLGRVGPGSAVLLCVNLSALSSAYCPGVSLPSVSGGLTAEEAVEIAFIAGGCPQVRVLDISEFNPAVEDYRTGRLLSSLVYHFLLSVPQRSRFKGPAAL